MKKLNLFYISIFCICLFLCPGCGLEEYYVVEAPFQRRTNPTVSDSGDAAAFDSAYFDFFTNDSGNSSGAEGGFKYMGTAVYYKIYNNYSTMNSHISTISSISSSTNSSSAFPKLQSYGYQELGGYGKNVSPLIPDVNGKDQNVFIRLTNYHEPADKNGSEWKDYAYRAKIVVNDVEKYVPMRQDNTKSFDFGRKNSSGDYDKPKSGEDDVNYGTASKENMYYITLYAVAVGHDNSFTNYYSNVLYLGSVAINASEEDN